MHSFKMEVFTALVAWALGSASLMMTPSSLSTHCSRTDTTITELGSKLSSTAKIYTNGTAEFEAASTRWSLLDAPKVSIVVVPGTENDVVEIVQYANSLNLPFLAYNGVHGAITTLGRMDHGIEIYLSQLSGVTISDDGATVTIAGGTRSKNVTDTLWAAGKQTVTGTCECVSTLGPALGGGHGWLQGRHGLVADQFVSMNVVLANGSLVTIDADSDLWWAMKGAGHNFGIVTSLTSKIYDIEYTDWAIETLMFSGDKVEEVYQAANDYILKNGTQSVDLINWSYWLNIAALDAEKPIILFYIIQEGVTSVDTAYTQAFHDIGALSIEALNGTYTDLAGWTDIDLDAAPCQKNGLNNPRFPIYIESYNITAQREAYDTYAAAVSGDSVFNASIFMFEGYSNAGVKAIDADSTAFAYRSDNLLAAPLITYAPADAALDAEAAALGNQLRQIVHNGSGREDLHTYLNYAFGDETPAAWYGSETWRQDKLKALKAKYDPQSKFSFYGPIA